MASLEIELDFDVSAFEKESDAYVRDVLIPASVDALNAAAEADGWRSSRRCPPKSTGRPLSR